MSTNTHVRTSKGKNDECYTPKYAVEVLLDFLEKWRGKTIWCPFDKVTSNFVQVLREYDYNVIYSHIDNGQDFFKYEPKKWDILISNPPFTNKSEIFKRALSFNKPFALLMTILWLNDPTPAKIFKDRNLQILSFDERIEFIQPNKTSDKKINFMSAYFCSDFLPKDFIFKTLKNKDQMRLWSN